MAWSTLIYCAICVLAAAFVRGYAGFGFSLIAITAMSLAVAPSMIIPTVFMMEVASSVSLLPGVWRDVNLRALCLLWIGCLVGTPFGAEFLARVPVAPLKIALGIVVFSAALLLLSGFQRKSMPSTPETIITGGIAGLLNGAFGIVAPPVIVFFFNSPAGAAVSRASLIAFFIGTDTMGLAFLARQGLVTSNSFYLFALFLPPLLLGQWLGACGFRSADPAAFRRSVLWLVVLLAIATGLQGILALRHGTVS